MAAESRRDDASSWQLEKNLVCAAGVPDRVISTLMVLSMCSRVHSIHRLDQFVLGMEKGARSMVTPQFNALCADA